MLANSLPVSVSPVAPIFVLNLIPAAIAAVTPLGGVVALQVCLFVYGGLCWLLTLWSRDRTAEGPVERAFLDVLPAQSMDRLTET